jgi:hypothetical protein
MKEIEKGPLWRYLYCVAEGPEAIGLRLAGVGGKPVYGIEFLDLVALVHDHDCEGRSGEIKDPELAKRLLLAHQEVVEGVFAKTGSVLPVGFGNVISAKGREPVADWLKTNYEAFKEKLERVRGKAEYGVQVFMDPEAAAMALKESVSDLKRPRDGAKPSPGAAYLREERRKEILRREFESLAKSYFNAFYKMIRGIGGEFKVERTSRVGNGKRMIMNLSCLLSEAQAMGLGEILEDIGSRRFVSLRFTGPWPPYSFV